MAEPPTTDPPPGDGGERKPPPVDIDNDDDVEVTGTKPAPKDPSPTNSTSSDSTTSTGSFNYAIAPPTQAEKEEFAKNLSDAQVRRLQYTIFRLRDCWRHVSLVGLSDVNDTSPLSHEMSHADEAYSKHAMNCQILRVARSIGT